jgi:hypothetical protein
MRMLSKGLGWSFIPLVILTLLVGRASNMHVYLTAAVIVTMPFMLYEVMVGE